jgi:uncharacterized protein YjiS (DUF1127 family)
MKENFDKHHVILSREMFDELRLAAMRGDFEANTRTVPRVMRHVRKYNLPLHQERLAELAKEQNEWHEKRRRVIAVINEYHGTNKQVYVHMGANTFHKAVILGKSPIHKLHVRVLMPYVSKTPASIGINDIYLELPVTHRG